MAEPAPVTILDVAAGTGMLSTGLKFGLELLGLRAEVVCGIERDSCAASAFLAGMELSQGWRPPLWDDATTFVGRRDRGLESVDCLTAGYPCQPFSSAGKRLGSKDDRHLWPAVRRIVARVKPSLVFLENVDGHVSLGLWKVLRDLERLGYKAEAGVFSAEEIGAPHLRKRVFILGSLADSSGSLGGPRPGRERVREAGGLVGSPTSRIGRCDQPEPGADRRTSLGRTGEELAECQSGGLGAMREPPGRNGLTQRSGDELGHSEHGAARRGEERPGQVEWTSVDRPIEELANDDLSLLEGGRPASGEPSRDGGINGLGGEFCRPIFPPHRTDYRRWAELAAIGLDTTLMPATLAGVPVVAHGLASSADLLRLGGNGVCPLTAAWAFINLACCLFGMET